jgi:hypothetical protein
MTTTDLDAAAGAEVKDALALQRNSRLQRTQRAAVRADVPANTTSHNKQDSEGFRPAKNSNRAKNGARTQRHSQSNATCCVK